MNINELVNGTLYLYDQTYKIAWDNMDSEKKANWYMFFDLCREKSNCNTEKIIDLIMSGMCPRKETVACTEYSWDFGDKYSPIRTVWYWNIYKAFSLPNNIIEVWHTPFTHYYSQGHIMSRTSKYPLQYSLRKKSSKIYAFTHIANAWQFLLNQMFSQEKRA